MIFWVCAFYLNDIHYRRINRRIFTLSFVLVNTLQRAGLEILTAVIMKISLFWDIPQCSTLEVNLRFRGTCRLHLQDWREWQGREQHETSCKQSSMSSPWGIQIKNVILQKKKSPVTGRFERLYVQDMCPSNVTCWEISSLRRTSVISDLADIRNLKPANVNTPV
jgi:hypothetical protein